MGSSHMLIRSPNSVEMAVLVQFETHAYYCTTCYQLQETPLLVQYCSFGRSLAVRLWAVINFHCGSFYTSQRRDVAVNIPPTLTKVCKFLTKCPTSLWIGDVVLATPPRVHIATTRLGHRPQGRFVEIFQ
jgi:hypothetical protein